MGLSQDQKDALLKKMRERQSKAEGGSSRDPLEWRPPKVDAEQEKTYKIIFLPPTEKGQTVSGSVVEKSMDAWFQSHGHHYINNRRYPCPRAMTNSDCPLCSTGFDMMKETDDKEIRKSIAKEWLSQQMHAVNIYFLKHKDNPEELHGKVMWWSIPVAIYNVCKGVLNSNDAGDEDEPKAHGMFFLPEECFTFNVVIKHKAGYNNYESSNFLGKPRALAGTDEEEADILARRINLASKFEEPNMEHLNKLLDEKASKSSTSSSSTPDDDAPPPRAKTTTEAKTEKPVEKPAESKASSDDDAPPPRAKATATATESKAEPKEEPKAETPIESDSDIDDLLKQL